MLSVQEPSGHGLLTRVRRDVPSTDQLHLPGTPVAIAVGDGSIWVTTTNGRTGALLRIDPRTRAVRTLVLPGLDATPTWVAVGAGAVWLTDAPRTSPTGSEATSAVPHSRLFRVDPETLRITGRRQIGCFTQGMCALAIGPDSVWIVADPGAGPFRVLRVDPWTLTGDRCDPHAPFRPGHVFSRAPVPVGPRREHDAGSAGDGAVRVDIRTSRIVARIHLLDHPNLFAFPSAIVTGGGSVWIAIAAPTMRTADTSDRNRHHRVSDRRAPRSRRDGGRLPGLRPRA